MSMLLETPAIYVGQLMSLEHEELLADATIG
jgi:hypothetical protein